MYSKVDRMSRRPHSKSQPCSPMTLTVSSANNTPTNNGRRPMNWAATYKHEKSRSELVPCSIPVFTSNSSSNHTPAIVPPPHTQERLIYERMDSSCSRGSSGSGRSSNATQIGPISGQWFKHLLFIGHKRKKMLLIFYRILFSHNVYCMNRAKKRVTEKHSPISCSVTSSATVVKGGLGNKPPPNFR